ncbi:MULTISPECIES: TadE/TadG family type IV pilus assembly protein [Pseudomonas]|jgi:hypothetical protein|uniref:Pilus assembly protein n=1 Tax=Pseudomonas marginalis TaxID=298 RepID=A0A9X9FVR5_PSEMA|nr:MULTISPECIES: hypothetical protein [Pseudomonas]MCS3514910.1 hypothetical protein [Pseudomonas grimontii]TWR52807.1 pilus assembly protein [Pseudomonas marginalis]SEC13477.1 hypothetical protein SAMN04490193_2002 [Pseudomonas marginalis]
MRSLPRRQRGTAMMEGILVLPLLIGTALVSADLYNVHQARAYMEQSVHNIASVLAAQPSLDSDGLDALLRQAASPKILGDYQLVISKVSLDRNMTWKPLQRGAVTGICPSYSQGQHYVGGLPEEQPPSNDETGETTTSKRSLLVVQLCRNTNTLLLGSGLLMDKDIEALAFSRMLYDEPELDKQLSREAGLEDEDAG